MNERHTKRLEGALASLSAEVLAILTQPSQSSSNVTLRNMSTLFAIRYRLLESLNMSACGRSEGTADRSSPFPLHTPFGRAFLGVRPVRLRAAKSPKTPNTQPARPC